MGLIDLKTSDSCDIMILINHGLQVLFYAFDL